MNSRINNFILLILNALLFLVTIFYHELFTFSCYHFLKILQISFLSSFGKYIGLDVLEYIGLDVLEYIGLDVFKIYWIGRF